MYMCEPWGWSGSLPISRTFTLGRSWARATPPASPTRASASTPWMQFVIGSPPVASEVSADDEVSLVPIHLLLPLGQSPFQVADHRGLAGRQVAALADVAAQVEQQLDEHPVVEELPGAVADRLLLAGRAVDAPEERPRGLRLLAEQDGEQVDAVGWPVPRRPRPRPGQEGGGQVHGDAGLADHPAARQGARPAHQAGDADASLPQGLFVMEQRGIVGEVRRPAVVAAQHDQGVV